MVSNPARYAFIVSGIAVGTVIFSLTYFFMFDARGRGIEALSEHGRMVEIGQSDPSSDKPFTPGIGMDLLRKTEAMPIPEIEKIATFKPFGWDNYVNAATLDNQKFMPYAANLLVVNSAFFDVIGTKFKSGNAENWQDNQAIIRSSFAKKMFGNTHPVGQTIDVWEGIDMKLASYTVAGVIKDVPVDAFNADVYAASFERVAERPARALALLKKDADINRINTQLAALKVPTNNGESFIFPQLKKVSEPKKWFLLSQSPTNLAVLFIAMLILLSALINFVNLLAESVTSRIRQFTLRRILGAGQGSIFLLLVFEVIPVLLVSLLLAYGLSEILLRLLSQGILSNYPDLQMYTHFFNQIPIKVMGWVFLVCVVLLSLFVHSLRNITATEGIRGKIRKVSKQTMRNSLIVVQLLFTFFLLSGVFAIVPFMHNISTYMHKTLPPKARPDAVFAVPLTRLNLWEHHPEIERDIQKISGVIDVLQMGAFTEFGEVIETDIPAYSNMPAGQMLPDSVALSYEVIMGGDNLIPFLYPAGENLLPKRELADNEVIISQSLADKLKKYPELQTIDLMGMPYKIAGVVPHIGFAFSPENGTVWLPLRHAPVSGLYVKSSPKDKKRVQREILSVIRKYLPESIPYEVESLSQTIERRAGHPQAIARVAYLIAVFALIIILFGIYTAVSTDTEKSRKSVAIRKINGAVSSDIYRLFGRLYVILVALSFVISAPAIFLIFNNLFIEVPVDTRPQSLPALVLALVCIVGFVALVVHRKLKNIAKINPAEVVKWE